VIIGRILRARLSICHIALLASIQKVYSLLCERLRGLQGLTQFVARSIVLCRRYHVASAIEGLYAGAVLYMYSSHVGKNAGNQLQPLEIMIMCCTRMRMRTRMRILSIKTNT